MIACSKSFDSVEALLSLQFLVFWGLFLRVHVSSAQLASAVRKSKSNHHHHGDVTDRLKRRIHALQSYHDTLQEALVSSDRAWSTCTVSLGACCEWSPQPKHEERSKKTKRTHTHSNHRRRGSRESWASQELTIGVKAVTREWQCVTSTTSETSCLILHGILSCARATLPFHLKECQPVSNTHFFPT